MVEQGKILINEKVGKDIWRMELKAPWIAMKAKPGQFVNVRLTEKTDPLLRRPISLHGIDVENGIISFLYLIVGKGTEMMSKLENGDQLDLLGPLGNGFTADYKGKRTILVGGGIGSAPLYPLLEMLKAKKKTVTLIYGAKDKESITCLDLYQEEEVDIRIATEDGSLGEKGFVTAPLEMMLKANEVDFIYACGPTPMLKAVETLALKYGVDGEISAEEHMGCGLGVCLTCSAPGKDGKNRKICTDGPVFKMGELAYE